MELNLSLENEKVYAGIKITETGGRKSFDINQENLNIIGKNIAECVKGVPPAERDEITLTGATAIPVYLTAFHAVLHNFHEVKFKNQMFDVSIAKHWFLRGLGNYFPTPLFFI